MNVYIVESGEKHEGGRVVSVHRTRENAIDVGYHLAKTSAKSLRWKLVEHPIKDVDENLIAYWSYGCDYVQVEKRVVND